MNRARTGPVEVVVTVLGIVFRGQSPERLTYTRRRLIWCAGIAVSVGYVARIAYWLQPTPHALLWIVIALGILLTAVRRWPGAQRFRTVRMLMGLFVISALGDGLLVLVALLPLPRDVMQVPGYLVAAVQVLGAAQCIRYGIRRPWHIGLLFSMVFLVTVTVLYQLIAPALDVFV